MKDYELYMEMIRRSVNRINKNIEDIENDDTDRLALIHIGLELRNIQAIIDEAYDLRRITYNSYHLLNKWRNRYYDRVVKHIIWL